VTEKGARGNKKGLGRQKKGFGMIEKGLEEAKKLAQNHH
jgi:hypothetical protein